MTDPLPPPQVAVVRSLIGLGQGLALYCLYLAYDAKTWPADGSAFFAPFALIAIFVPLILAQGVGNIRARTLFLWAGIAAAVIGALAVYDVWHAWPTDFEDGEMRVHFLPSPPLVLALVAELFIAQALVTGGDSEGRWLPRYATHFDVAWKLALQTALSVVFTGAFWLSLLLAAALFNLIRIDAVETLIERKWFAFPATTIVFAAALHITDVKSAIVRGMRTLVLTLLSWLLPLLALIATAFLLAILFTGVQPLWDTRFATRLLLATSAALVVLINAAYQDGRAEHAVPRILRYAGMVAAFVLAPLSVLAAIALWLRVAQYGWTTDRIYAAACVFIAALYAVGYAFAAVRGREPWLKRVERWNFYASLMVLAVALLIFSPVLDPYRISVADQMARLESGKVASAAFDFGNLRWNGGRFGYDALQRLKTFAGGADAGHIRTGAAAALDAKTFFAAAIPVEVASLSDRLIIHPAGTALPASFTTAVPARMTSCFNAEPRETKCDVWVMDVDGDGQAEIAIGSGLEIWVFAERTPQQWELLGSWSAPDCKGVAEALRTDSLALAMPNVVRPDLEVAGIRVPFREQRGQSSSRCPS
jgi:hypothetical protein